MWLIFLAPFIFPFCEWSNSLWKTKEFCECASWKLKLLELESNKVNNIKCWKFNSKWMVIALFPEIGNSNNNNYFNSNINVRIYILAETMKLVSPWSRMKSWIVKYQELTILDPSPNIKQSSLSLTLIKINWYQRWTTSNPTLLLTLTQSYFLGRPHPKKARCQIGICLPIIRLLSDLNGICSFMKIPLHEPDQPCKMTTGNWYFMWILHEKLNQLSDL